MSLPSSPASAPSSSDDPSSRALAILKREYWCFISYRHADNKVPGRQWATWLHQALETYEVPGDLVGTQNERGDVIPERIFPVFRDEEELPADAELSKPIAAALKRSRFMVVLCSPQAVASRYVAEEIVQFKQQGRGDRLLAAIIEGEPNASDDPAKGGAEKECFPTPLRHEVQPDGSLTKQRTEPIAADFRLPDGSAGWTSPVAHRQSLIAQGLSSREADVAVQAYAKQQNLMLLKIIAGILGLPLGLLTQRDLAYQLERQKRQARSLRRWLLAVGAIGVVAVVAGFVAYQNGQRAEAQRKNAQAQEMKAVEQANEARRQKIEAEKQTAEAEKQRNTATQRGKEVVDEKAKQDKLLQVASRGDNESAMRSFAAGNHGEGMAYLDRALINYPSNTAALISTVNHAFGPASAPYAMRSVQEFEGGMTRFSLSKDAKWAAIAGRDLSCRILDIATGKVFALSRLDGEALWTAFSPDSHWLAVACKDKTLCIYEASTGNRLHRIAFDGPVTSVDFSPDGNMVLTGSGDHTARLHQVISGRQVWEHAVDNEIRDVSYSPDGKWMAVSGKGNLCWILDAANGEVAWTAELGGPIKMMLLSPDGRWLAFISADKNVSVCDVLNREFVGKPLVLADTVNTLSFSPDSKWLAATSKDNTCRVINPATAGVVKEHKFTANAYTVDFSPDGRLILVGTWEKNCYVLDALSGVEVGRAFMGDYVRGLRFSADGGHIVAGNANGTFRILETTRVREVNRTDFAVPISTLSVNADGHHLAVCTTDGLPRLINVENGTLFSGEANSSSGVVQFSPDGVSLAVGGSTGWLMLNEVKTRKSIFVEDFKSPISALKFSVDGKYLGVGHGDGTTRVLDFATNTWRKESRFKKTVRAFEFSPDGHCYVMGGDDKTLCVMDTATGTGVNGPTFEGVVSSLAFSPGGRQVSAGSWTGELKICGVAEMQIIHEIKYMSSVSHLEYSADGRFIAAVVLDKTLRLLDAATSQQIYRLDFASQIRAMDYSPDGRLIAVGTDDKALCIIEADSGQIVSFMRFGGKISQVQFFPDSLHLAFSSDDKSVRVIDCRWLNPKGGSPNQILSESALRPGVHFDAHGRLEVLSAADLRKALDAVSTFLRETPEPTDEWQRAILNWERLPAELRTTSPWSQEPIAKAVGRWIMDAPSPEAAADCANQALWHPLEPISLIKAGPATEGDDLPREKFLARLTLKRLREADPAIYDRETQWAYITWSVRRMADKNHLLEQRLEGVNLAFDFAPSDAVNLLKEFQKKLTDAIAETRPQPTKSGSKASSKP